jgi:hypothetical protein
MSTLFLLVLGDQVQGKKSSCHLMLWETPVCHLPRARADLGEGRAHMSCHLVHTLS